MDEMDLTCICCPIGCGLRATLEAGQVVRVTGNTCPRGEAYARREAVSPMRTVTSSVAVEGGVRPVVPVKTVPDVPKDRIFPVMDAIRDLTVPAPVRAGDVLLRDVAGTGADVVATAGLDKAP